MPQFKTRLIERLVLVAILSFGAVGCSDSDEEGNADSGPASSSPVVERPARAVWCPDAYDVVRERERDRGNGASGVTPRSPGDEPPPAKRFDARRILGLDLQRAEQVAAKSGCTVRVIRRDDEDLPRTDDLRPNRVNVTTQQGVVVELEGIA